MKAGGRDGWEMMLREAISRPRGHKVTLVGEEERDDATTTSGLDSGNGSTATTSKFLA